MCVCTVCVCVREEWVSEGKAEGQREREVFLFNSLCWRCTTSGIFCHLIHFSRVANSQGIFSITEKWIVCVCVCVLASVHAWVCEWVCVWVQRERQRHSKAESKKEKKVGKKRDFERKHGAEQQRCKPRGGAVFLHCWLRTRQERRDQEQDEKRSGIEGRGEQE